MSARRTGAIRCAAAGTTTSIPPPPIPSGWWCARRPAAVSRPSPPAGCRSVSAARPWSFAEQGPVLRDPAGEDGVDPVAVDALPLRRREQVVGQLHALVAPAH